jgi:putative sigma-54 modulation protein
MKINISTVHFDADQKLIDFVNQKVKKLTQFYEEIISSEIILRLDNNDELGNKIAEIRMVLPGGELFAKKQCKSFEEATDQCIDALKPQILRHKEKFKR